MKGGFSLRWMALMRKRTPRKKKNKLFLELGLKTRKDNPVME